METEMSDCKDGAQKDARKQQLDTVKAELASFKTRVMSGIVGFTDAKHTCKQPHLVRPTATTPSPFSALATDED